MPQGLSIYGYPTWAPKWMPPTPITPAKSIPTSPFPAFARMSQDVNTANVFGPPQLVGYQTGGVTPPSIPDAPYDGSTYGRNNGLWSNVIDCGFY